jgi:hypothetical protein
MAIMPMLIFFWLNHHAAMHMNTMAVRNMPMSRPGFLGQGMQSPSTLSTGTAPHRTYTGPCRTTARGHTHMHAGGGGDNTCRHPTRHPPPAG